jgi:DNA-binding response OmpR family regulator
MQVVVIEDNEVLAGSIVRVLEHEGYSVTVLPDGESGEQFIRENKQSIDAVVLDILLPKQDGLSVLKNLRAHDIHTPILMLTSKDTTGDVVAGLTTGADDYLKKPFEFDELLARLRALLRRGEALESDVNELNPALSVNLSARTVTKKGNEVHLTPKEFGMLEYLLRNKNTVVTQQDLYDHVFDFVELEASNTMEVHLKNLRKKLTTQYEQPIKTVRGVGYRLDI